MPLGEARFVCATYENQERARNGLRASTELIVFGVNAFCPFAPEPLDFVKRVHLGFAADQLVRIDLVPTSYEKARERLFEKYGGTPLCVVGGKAVLWSRENERRANGCAWNFDGGDLMLRAQKGGAVIYLSDKEGELSKQGF